MRDSAHGDGRSGPAALVSGQAPPVRRGEIAAAREGLSLLRSELNREVVSALAGRGPMTTSDLRAWLVVGSSSTIGKCVDELLQASVLRVRRGRVHEFALTTAGHELAELVEWVDAWLASHPRRDIARSSVGGRALRAAADGWRAAILDRVLRSPPRVGDLTREPDGVSRRRLKSDLATLVGAGVLELRMTREGVQRYRATEWGRRFVGLVVAVARWERSHLGERAAPFEIDDMLLALVAALPLLRIPESHRGHCTLTVELGSGVPTAQRAGGVWANFGPGRVLNFGEGAAPRPPVAWASGPVDAWFAALVDGRSEALRSGGDDALFAKSVIEELHRRLLGYQKQ